MKHLSLMLCLILVFGSAMAQKKKKQKDRFEGLDQELETVLETWKAAGFAVAVVEKNEIVYAKGFGFRDVEKQLPVTENTLFAIGSSTKAFTSGVLGQLREDTDLDFGESPIKYIPELRFYNEEMNNGITIQDMMCHRTGLPRHDFSWYFFPADNRDELIGRIAHQEPFTGLRQNWYYNNFMFMAQGVIAERMTDKSWEQNIEERFFTPLGMETSNCSIDELTASKDYATGYSNDADENIVKEDYYRIASMGPAGSINSSVKEMSEWIKLWINGGSYNGEQILSSGYVREAMTPQMVMGGGVPGVDHPDVHIQTYGYGWMMGSYKGHYRVEHGGNINGFSANVAFYPSDSVGIVVLTNQSGSSIPSIVRNTVIDRMLGIENQDWNGYLRENFEKGRDAQAETMSGTDEARQMNTSPSHNLAEYTGHYSNAGYGEFDVIFRNDSLIADWPITPQWLEHYHYDIFKPYDIDADGVDTTENSSLRFNFQSSNSGDIESLSVQMEPTLSAIEFGRTPLAVEVDANVLAQYEGEYALGGAVVKVYIKDENTLYVVVPGQPEYELLPTAEHKFAIKILNGYNVAFVSEGDEITALKFIQPNGTFEAKKK